MRDGEVEGEDELDEALPWKAGRRSIAEATAKMLAMRVEVKAMWKVRTKLRMNPLSVNMEV